MYNAHQCDAWYDDTANPSTGSSSTQNTILATRNPQPNNVTMMANAINDIVKSNFPSRVKIREPNPFDGSNPKKLPTFLLRCKLNFWDHKDLFQDETTKVNYVLSYLKGPALDCFKPGWKLVQAINVCYWECKAEITCKTLTANSSGNKSEKNDNRKSSSDKAKGSS